MEKIISICFGFNGENSKNANAICLNEIIKRVPDEKNIIIITNTEEPCVYEEEKDKVKTCYIPIDKIEGVKLNFIKWKKDVLAFIKKNIEVTDKTILFTISFPFPIQKIGLRIKQMYPNVKWVIYELDPYAYNMVLRYPKIIFPYRYIQENKVFKKADTIMLTHELFIQYEQCIFKKYNTKFIDIGIPMMKIEENNNVEKSEETICKFMYIGSFYPKIREPKYMLQMLSMIMTHMDKVEFHIYGVNDDEIAIEYKNQFGNKLVNHGRVPKKEIDNALRQATLFINIGNAVLNQLPSKVLEYMGTGKPIINFYSIDNDTSKKYLEKYDLALNIREDIYNKDINVKLIEKFILNNLKHKVNKEELVEKYESELCQNVVDKIYKNM